MLKVGEYLGRGKGRREILEVVELRNGWILVKTKNTKSDKDFKVRTVTNPELQRFYTPKYAHFAIDFFGKLCQNKEKAKDVFKAIIEVWHGKDVKRVIEEFTPRTEGLVGYDLDYILYAVGWILEQEDINFGGRPKSLQEQLDKKCQEAGVKVPEGRLGSQLAISLFCDIINGVHPVEALLAANLDIVPRFARR
ncbi:MAG: hypothetical protein H5T44_04090 [Thermoplasmatales archaeon]|nr:hypothetical protein [Thermoplasmatales archaeon]